jgi:hypothetical protein
MKKTELEQVLMDCERTQRLCEQAAKCRPCVEPMGFFNSQFRRVEPRPGEGRPSQEVIAKQYKSVEQHYALAGFAGFVPEATGKSPLEILEHLNRRFAERPTLTQARLIVDAMNRVTLAGELEAKSSKVVGESVQLLAGNGGGRKGKGKSNPVDNIFAQLFEDADRKGSSFFMNEPAGIVYEKVSNLDNLSAFNDRISSLTIGAGVGEVGGEVVLFEDRRFFGRYAVFAAPPGMIGVAPARALDVPYVGNVINDRASSVLLIRRFANELPATPIGNFVSREAIANFVRQRPGIALRGDPILTWDMWPEGPEQGSDAHPNAPDQAFIYIRIPVSVDVPNWFDYDAEIRYWVFLFVDAGGILRGHVEGYGAWVEGGVITGSVLSKLMDGIDPTVVTVQGFVDGAMNLANAFGPFESVHFLPGRHDPQGHTDEDVSIVLTRLMETPDGPIW